MIYIWLVNFLSAIFVIEKGKGWLECRALSGQVSMNGKKLEQTACSVAKKLEINIKKGNKKYEENDSKNLFG